MKQVPSTAAPELFDLLDPAVIEDPYPFYAALREHAPIYRVPNTPLYLVSCADLINDVLRDQEHYTANLNGILMRDGSGSPAMFDLLALGGSVDALANADEPAHAVHRKLVLPQLNARSVAAMATQIRNWAAQHIDALLPAGGDSQALVANPLPVKVMAQLIGLPGDDADRLLQWAFSGGDLLAGTADLNRLSELGESTRAMADYLTEHFRAACRQPVDTPGNILQELVSGVSMRLISERDAVAILIVLVGAAGESTASLIGSAILRLASDTTLQSKLRGEVELIDAFVEEVVRLESPFKGHYRAVTRRTQLGEASLEAGDYLFLQWAAANRDPRLFTRPDTVDLQRANTASHLGFGYGMHYCIGARLARLEARIVLEELLGRGIAFELDPERPAHHVPSIFVRRPAELYLRFSR